VCSSTQTIAPLASTNTRPDCKARVIRIDPGFAGKRPPGFGVTIDPVDQDNRERLTNLLLRASGYTVGGKS